MIPMIDFRVFGNGRGMATPFFSGVFYWLPYFVDGDSRRRGDFYSFGYGFGAQLTSYQWTLPDPSETRTIKGRKFKVFNSYRRWGRVRVDWAMVGMPKSLDAVHAEIKKLRDDLGRASVGVAPQKLESEGAE